MRDFLLGRIARGVSSFCMIMGVASAAAAQEPAPAAAPAPAAPVAAAPAPLAAPPLPPPAAAPLGYPGYPGYPPPPGYGYQQPYEGRPRRPVDDSVPYEGGPVPSGYHVESRPRRGLLISGPIILGVPYVLGVSIAGGQNFPNSSGWLLVPGIGPWITLAARHKNSCVSSPSGIYYDDCSDSSNDDATRTSLILSGFMQTGGAIMFIVGLASPKKVIAHDFVGSLHWAPSTVGRSGYGGFVWGEF